MKLTSKEIINITDLLFAQKRRLNEEIERAEISPDKRKNNYTRSFEIKELRKKKNLVLQTLFKLDAIDSDDYKRMKETV